ncbi:MAG: hypothetical protein ACAH12_01110 [Methylophilaceae bacterium]
MNRSPLTFLSLKFLRVHVAADFKSEQKGEKVDKFDFSGNKVGWTIKHGHHDDGSWWVAVGFRNTNEDVEVIAPYLIDVQAIGSFIVGKLPPNIIEEKIIYESGGALVYGAIRDMVSSITARAVPGHVMLPTPTFLGEFELHQKKLVDSSANGKDDPPFSFEVHSNEKPKKTGVKRKLVK